ncbi:hemerythrin domain-containing protein [Geotalea sp. SG265]|uniref:hemerythrin domain-containing protein n=1 Tax=Geotalea sp. SG265 TaxID=2922867 RepID=UPI001FAFAA2C|nr:hemerythrin domain-containing protein [Geotalea sp. SG265]
MARKQSSETDVFQILRTDHQEVTKLMDQLKQAGGQQKQQLFAQLQEELNTHMNLEERFFYPKLEEIEDLADLVQDSYADHDDIRQILQQMNEQDFDSDEWQANCEALEDTKDDHVDVEEEEIFPQAMELVDGNVLSQIGEQIAAEKGKTAEPAAAKPRPQKRPPRAHA